MSLHDMLNDGQSQPRSPLFTRASLIHSVKSFKEPRMMFYRNSRTRIPNLQNGETIFDGFPSNRNSPVRGSVLVSIVQEVDQNLFNSGWVGKYFRDLGFY